MQTRLSKILKENPTLNDNTAQTMTYRKASLPALPFYSCELEPIISKQLLRIHHSKVHGNHVQKFNKLLALLEIFVRQLGQSRTDADSKLNAENAVELRRNLLYCGGGHINHSMFWENLAPFDSKQTKDISAPQVMTEMAKRWGSVAAFQGVFENSVLDGVAELNGGGWAWLVWSCEEEQLEIKVMVGERILPSRYKPLLAIDVWEHAYYVQYNDDKGDYLERIWLVVNWEVVERRFRQTVEEIYGNLIDWCRLHWLGVEVLT